MTDLPARSATCSARLGPRSCTRAPHSSGHHADAEGTWLGHTPPVLTLTEFLLARIAEDEAVAQAIVASPIETPGGYWETRNSDYGEIALAVDPARVLAECKAKRRIVDWHRLIDGLDTDDNPVRGCCNCIASGAEPPYIIAGPCMTLQLHALPYAEHPSYRREWAP